MKIIITGSLGHISKPLVEELIRKGHSVTVISSNPERTKEIETIGAIPSIGKMEDSEFLSQTFQGADIVYAMEAIGYESFFDHNLDIMETIRRIANSYKIAIEQSGIRRVIHLSSIGAHTNSDSGILAFHHEAENILRKLPSDVSIKFMRPVGFYYNMFAFIQTIKSRGSIISNYGGDEIEPWVSPSDIAKVIAEEIEKPFEGRSIRYIASDEISPNEIAKILGEAIGKPDLKWTIISDEESLNGMIAAGMNPKTAKGFMEMNASRRGGVLYEDYFRNQPILERTKLKDFAKDFATAYERMK
ncbi:SDR family oxidoreductase [Leptospira andrefontaineae]|uniref:NAD-dependent epimerase/dehydratase family protein n=1 Tax=Leptospira andrefontaineae TaxID=2484976 RepID=A0A4R9H8Q7_9LEPT|nr:NAD(P)H-binding protein [Leptospira andrefontaineae]TGK42266.1 NAD-dependent epimerase/dehydratase family protein [Leptospira andrefontaineae]